MSAKPTKERILNAAEELMLENSFHSVGLTQILNAVNVPKGSFYHHFDSKEEFGIELLKHYTQQASAWKREKLLSPKLDTNPLDRLFSYLEEGVSTFQARDGKCPCLIIKLAAEVSSMSEGMRDVLDQGFSDWVKIYKSLLEQAQKEKALPNDHDISVSAQVIQDLWYGAYQRAIACRSVKPLRNAIQSIKALLLSSS